MLKQKDIKGRRLISIKPETYDKLIELGRMGTSFDDIIREIMEKADIDFIVPDMEQT
jgi:predicted CopG family antitoxin